MMRVRVPLQAAAAIVPAFILAVLVMLGGNALLRVYIHNTAYPAYLETLDLSEGSIGSAPTPDTPQAKSIADMESMDTFYIIGAVGWDHPRQVNGQRYYEVEIKTDLGYTTILAQINADASERLETGGRRLPIGRWLPLEDPEGTLEHSYILDSRDHYADMLGDFGKVITEGQLHARHPVTNALEAAAMITLLLAWAVIWRFFSKKGWF